MVLRSLNTHLTFNYVIQSSKLSRGSKKSSTLLFICNILVSSRPNEINSSCWWNLYLTAISHSWNQSSDYGRKVGKFVLRGIFFFFVFLLWGMKHSSQYLTGASQRAKMLVWYNVKNDKHLGLWCVNRRFHICMHTHSVFLMMQFTTLNEQQTDISGFCEN